ncbi:MAG: ABC transporter ATP-binding protein [Deltaproteobacteria bacterium]|nr:ABC transporter ATP-binding protein [Deltaproteobacteria bacterium]
MSAPLVDIRKVGKRFDVPGHWPWSPRREVRAVIDVDLQVADGEVVALVGQSGSGKTTLSRMVLGLENPTEGEIWIEGRRWDTMPERERQARRVSYQYVPQDAMSALDPQQTVVEAVVETLTVLARVPRAEASDRAAAMLSRLGLSHRHHALPRQLSGGEQRRVTLARVLALVPRLVVADEPTSGLDPDRRAAVLEDLVGNLPDKAGCILVTHDLDAAIPYCHRVVVMLEGRVVEVADLRNHPPAHPYTRSLLDPWHDPGGAP